MFIYSFNIFWLVTLQSSIDKDILEVALLVCPSFLFNMHQLYIFGWYLKLFVCDISSHLRKIYHQIFYYNLPLLIMMLVRKKQCSKNRVRCSAEGSHPAQAVISLARRPSCQGSCRRRKDLDLTISIPPNRENASVLKQVFCLWDLRSLAKSLGEKPLTTFILW